MVNSLKPIKVTATSDWTRILDKATDGPVLLERHGVVFQITRQAAVSTIAYKPNAAQVHQTLDDVAGTWADLDADQLIEDVYTAREAGSRTADRI